MKPLLLFLLALMPLGAFLVAHTGSGRNNAPGWSMPVNLGPAINTAHQEQFPALSPDGLSLYFASNRPGGMADSAARGFESLDIYVSRQISSTDSWKEPIQLPAPINTRFADHSVAFSPDGHWMYFASTRPGGCGKHDLYLSYRQDSTDDLGWEEPRNLRYTVNNPADDSCPFFHTDEKSGETSLYFVSTRSGGPCSLDVYVSRLDEKTGSFGEPELLKAVNSAAYEGHFDVREGILWSGNSAWLGGGDLWYATPDENNNWKHLQNVGPPVNTEFNDGCFSLNSDGTSLYLVSDRPGGLGGGDIYLSRKIMSYDN